MPTLFDPVFDRGANAHAEWLGYVQPVGIVVSSAALLQAGVLLNRDFIPLHSRFLSILADGETTLADPHALFTTVLGWRAADLEQPDAALTILVPGPYDDLLSPDYVVRIDDTTLLIRHAEQLDLDSDLPMADRRWNASPQLRFERLLRETGNAIGLLISAQAIRLVYAPKGESSGFITFNIAEMAQVAGRPILAALHMLLSAERLFSVPREQRLPALLSASRKYQNTVSIQLAGQVMEALYDLLRGFQTAHDQTGFLRDALQADPHQIYVGLLTVLLRLLFLLYAEDKELLPSSKLFSDNYSLGGLFQQLTEDYARYPDTMDQRYGAWARLLVLFRLIYGGTAYQAMPIPGRRGYLFDPERFPFLEGDPGQIPRVADGVIFRVLQRLLVLNGERLSYRSLDVEQIGSVYESIMGFELHIARGPSIALKPKKTHGAPVTINLAALLALDGGKRNEWLAKTADTKLTGRAEQLLKTADDHSALLAALENRIARKVTPDPVPAGSMIFQPSAERRRSGSHYTPRALTAPIVEAALEPVLARLGQQPTPQQILALKVCDPAMGSGAFLVEACRQLGNALVAAWQQHEEVPELLPDEDEVLHARRLVAQRCLYGVDKNPVAVDLAKLSLWLATMARDHEFTFLDHALRHGDSLVGFSAQQIAAFRFHAAKDASTSFLEGDLRENIVVSMRSRQSILQAPEGEPYAQRAQKLALAEGRLQEARTYGDLLAMAFFDGRNARSRSDEVLRLESEVKLARGVDTGKGATGMGKPDVLAADRLARLAEALRTREKPIAPFHWELEFPEVFELNSHLKPTGGFDAIVGNPPFAGKNTLIEGSPEGYIDWLKQQHPESHGNADVVAHFFRRAYTLLAPEGCFGLIATNTIGQGDTRSSGLRWIVAHGGTIYRAVKRFKWPGEAAVVVSVVHVSKAPLPGPYLLGGKDVDRITAYLFHAGGSEDPKRLEENAGKSFQGSIVLGMGFTFDDTDTRGVASSLAEMRRLIEKDPRNAERIFPYLGGEEVNNSPTHAHHRYVINFEDFPLCRKASGHSWFELTEETQRRQMREGAVAPDYPGPVAEDWPDLLAIVRERVKPERLLQNDRFGQLYWWRFLRTRPELLTAKSSLNSVIACARIGNAFAFTMTRKNLVLNEKSVVFATDCFQVLCCLQSRTHELWTRFFSSTLKDDLQYTPSDCFETFPFPEHYESNEALEEAGRVYYEFRAALMVRNNEGLTKTYNRFHRPDEYAPEISELRRLHAAMDRAVLDAYGWHDIPTDCAFVEENPEEDDEDEPGERRGRARQKKYRYRWPDAVHDEVLARLLALNLERAGVQTEVTNDEDEPEQNAPRKSAGRLPSSAKKGEARLFAEKEFTPGSSHGS